MSLTPEQREALAALRRWNETRERVHVPIQIDRLLAAFPPEERPWQAWPRLGEWEVAHNDHASQWESRWPTEAAARARADELNRREP